MKLKRFVSFCFGTILILFGVYASLIQYNPGSTVHEFAYGCNLRITEFTDTYSEGFDKYCGHNTALSLVVFAVVATGGFLCFRSRPS